MGKSLNMLVLIAALSAFPFASSSAQAPATPAAPSTSQAPAVKVKPAVPAAQPQAAAPLKSGPDTTSETYGDWVMRCQQTNDAKRCEVSQTIVMQGQQAPLALIAFGREKKSEPIRIVVQLPTNVTFEGGVKTLTATGDTLDLTLRRCFPIGCFADAKLDDGTIAKLKTQTEPASLKFRDGTEREISLPLSMRGLGAAIDALART